MFDYTLNYLISTEFVKMLDGLAYYILCLLKIMTKLLGGPDGKIRQTIDNTYG